MHMGGADGVMTEEEREARVWHHEMVTNEGIHEQSVRIVALEELVLDMWGACPKYEPICAECEHARVDDSGEWPVYDCDFYDRMQELGGGRVSTIELHERYPQSRREDIIDAYMRGYINGLQTCQTDNAKLRELMVDIYASADFWLDHFGDSHKFRKRMRELGIEVD